jgi:polysaccharide biosynthesis protein PslH
LRILYFSPRECWPLTTGARLRDYHLARQLGRYAELTYFGMRAWDEAPAELPPASSGFKDVTIVQRDRAYTHGRLLRGLTGPDPVTVLNYWSPRAAAVLEKTLRAGNFDSIQVEGVHLARYLPVIREAAPDAAVIADWHNIESEIVSRYASTNESAARRLFARRTAQLLERAESTLLTACDQHTVASDRERDTLQRRSPAAVVGTVPNGVDVSYYAQTGGAVSDACRDILFVGSMDYHANIDAVQWMVRDGWPKIRSVNPGLRLVIAGRKPAPSVLALACEDVLVTGTVEDVRPFYARALVVVVPLRVGSGTRLKILEAMAAGVPVVSTTLGAEGLRVEDGVNILVADTGDEIATAICRLATRPEWRDRLVRAARDLVTKAYDWAGLGTQLYGIHEDAADRSRLRLQVRPPAASRLYPEA